ncbi:MAG: OmpA family protein [Burkholderiales bacterium]|nr:OmpA family protein [Burkholderiales bacterium]
MDGQQAENSEKFTKAAAARRALEKRITAKQEEMQAEIEGASTAAKEALERATAAGKLAEGKFMYETTVSSQLAFEFETSKLSAGMMTKLNEFAAQLKADNKNVYIEIQGHTDSSGSEATNLKIAQERADAVRDYLAKKGGIALHRINAISYGESAPIASNKTRAGRTENRRVTLVVLH